MHPAKLFTTLESKSTKMRGQQGSLCVTIVFEICRTVAKFERNISETLKVSSTW